MRRAIPPKQLLVLNVVDHGDGFEQLCAFLNRTDGPCEPGPVTGVSREYVRATHPSSMLLRSARLWCCRCCCCCCRCCRWCWCWCCRWCGAGAAGAPAGATVPAVSAVPAAAVLLVLVPLLALLHVLVFSSLFAVFVSSSVVAVCWTLWQARSSCSRPPISRSHCCLVRRHHGATTRCPC